MRQNSDGTEKRNETGSHDGATLSGGGVSLTAFAGSGNWWSMTSPPRNSWRACGRCRCSTGNKTPIPAELFDQCPNLRYVGECATGYNNIDIAAAKAHGVTVCNVGGYSADAVAQHTFALILHHYSRVAEYDTAVWQGMETGKDILRDALSYAGTRRRPGSRLWQPQKVAAIGAAFGMRPVIATRTQPADCPYPLVTVDEAFRLADVLTLHVPLTEQTAGMVNARRLSAMKPTALLVNTARGGLIVETDLAQALRTV
ncbi:MAG: NAD(P)-dependent oxidoreductase [Ruminococcus sp.]